MSTCTAIKEVQEVLGKNLSSVDSASLRLRKLLFLGDNSRGDEINAVCKCINDKTVQRRWSSNWALPSGVEAGGKSILLRLEGRLVIHLAGGILENAGMCIHPHFNCPFIPGSGVKCIARHAAWAKWDETKSVEDALKVAWTFGCPTGDAMPKKEKDRTRKEEEYLDNFLEKQRPEWFGENGKYKTFAGSVAFLPAFPVEGDFKAVADIITCHHPDYYGGRKEMATDDESPNPQFIPAIEEGSLFRFVVRPLGRMAGEVPSSETVMKWAEQFLVEGMTLYGAGAKTAAGYGWFSEDKEAAAKQKAEEEARAQKAEAERLAQEQAAAEAARLATLSPVDREKALVEKMTDEEFAALCKQLGEKSDEIKLAVVAVFKTSKKEKWKTWKRRKPDLASEIIKALGAFGKELS
ncbi:MAG: type III-B CRISPR module RAMP protein Cmr6 [Lentisphaerae bacterium]|nr:type III-B CRISPR module RAMP protein Cmr6 [Lentisphaerota bacterium]